ncbi:MAG: hypothetical protein HKM28_05615, partial [Flavobacteriaceae bacterium]|nr:hypothetical protein [Flavobacteriaceae bacterium]
MKTTYTILNRKSPFFILAGVFAFILTSCGAHQHGVSTSNDGIYEVEDDVVVVEDDNAKANYYKQYFQSKENAYSDLPEEGAIFTDIEAYSTTERIDDYGNIIIEETDESYGAWGDNPENITLVVNNYGGFRNPYWGGFYGGWGFNAYWGNPYWGYAGYWGNPYWGFGGYWNNPWYGGFYNAWCPPYYYGGYGYGYGNGYHTYAYAYNRGRRNTDYLAGRNNSGRRNAYTSRTNSTRFNGRTNSRGNSRGTMS